MVDAVFRQHQQQQQQQGITPYLGIVDRVIGPDGTTEWTITAHLSPSGLRLMVLADGRIEDAQMRSFFTDCLEALGKVSLGLLTIFL